MAVIDWAATVERLDADPDTATPAGTAVLSALVTAGRRYDAAGKPDVLYESAQHKSWASRLPSQRLGVHEPEYYVATYYARWISAGRSTSILNKAEFTAEDLAVLPKHALQSYQYWKKRAEQVPAEMKTAGANAHQIARYFIAEAEAEQRAARAARAPTYGRIQSELVAALEAAQAWLAS